METQLRTGNGPVDDHGVAPRAVHGVASRGNAQHMIGLEGLVMNVDGGRAGRRVPVRQTSPRKTRSRQRKRKKKMPRTVKWHVEIYS